MRPAIFIFVFLWAAAAVAAPLQHAVSPEGIEYEWTAVSEVEVAWRQDLLESGGWALASQYASDYPFHAETADDFLCNDGRPVAAVEWWGAYWNPGAPPYADAFVVRFYGNDAAGPSPRPGALLAERMCLEVTEELLPDQSWWYRYYCELDPPFDQEAGETYWISIQAVYSWYEGGQWGWGECVHTDWWGGEAVYVFDALGVNDWTPVSASDPYEPRECAFVLYKDVMNPVAESSWSSVKALFR